MKRRTKFLTAVAAFTLAGCDISTYGADGSGPGGVAQGGGNPYLEPTCSSVYYDNYITEVGSAQSGGGSIYDSPGPTGGSNGTDNTTYIYQAEYDYFKGHGAGAGAYFFMGGPQWAAPNETPYLWGVGQANAAATYFNQMAANNGGNAMSYGFIFGDIEMGVGNTNGWYYPASGSQVTDNQSVWQGFYTTLQNAGINVGVYSDNDNWSNALGGVTVQQIEWTYQQDIGPTSPCPGGLFSNGPGGESAQFFGGITTSSNLAMEWQWSHQGGDYDYMDLGHWNNLFGAHQGP